MPNELPIGSSVYRCSFFKEIDSHSSSHLPEDCQHDLFFPDHCVQDYFSTGELECFCVTLAPRPPRYINFFEPFHFTADDQLLVPIGISHISLRLQEIQSREWEKKNKRTICLGQFKRKKGVMQHCISCVHM